MDFRKKSLLKLVRNLSGRRKIYYSKSVAFIKRRPMASFFIAMAVLFLAIFLNALLTPQPKTAEKDAVVKPVNIYRIGSAPRVNFSAKVDKEGVIQIVAQTPGIVSSVNVFEGQVVYRGSNLISLANNYQGGNALSVQRQMAATQYQNIKDTYETQKSLISNQKLLASKVDENSDEMRAITERSVGETRDLITLNASVIVSLEETIRTLEQTGGDPATITQTRSLLVQARSANNQLYQGLRNSEYQASGQNPPAELSDLQRESTLKQLEVQEKALDLSREASRLQLVLAQISEATMYPAAPFEGIVQKVHVVLGQAVNPGMPLVTLAGTNKNATVTATVPAETAKKISDIEDSVLHIGGQEYLALPDYISTEATDGLLNSVTFALPDEVYDKVSDGEYIKIEVPIGNADTLETLPYIPIDIVSQTQDGAYVYVLKNNQAESKKITLGDVVGSNVAVLSGLSNLDQVILDRNIIDGEKVKATN